MVQVNNSEREQARLGSLRKLDLLDTPADALLDTFTELAAAETGLPVSLISLVDQDRVWFKSAYAAEQGVEIPRDRSFCDCAMSQDDVFEVQDARLDPRFSDTPLVTGPAKVIHYAGVSLRMPDGARIGALCVIDHKPGRLAPEERRVLTVLARSVVKVILARESRRCAGQGERLSHFETVAELAPLGLVSINQAGEVCYANSHWQSLWGGADAIDAMGAGWLNAIHLEDQPKFVQDWANAIGDRRALATDVRTRHGRWIRLRMAPVDQDASAASFVGSAADITERIELLARSVEQNQLLEAVIRHLPSGVIVYDDGDRHVVSNATGRRLLGAPDSAFAQGATFQSISLHLALAGELGPGDPEELARQRNAVLDFPSSRGEMCIHRQRPDGTAIDIRGVKMPNGWTVHVYSDVTAQVRQQQNLVLREQRLDLALKASSLGMWEYAPLEDKLFLSEGWGVPFGYPAGESILSIEDMADMAPDHAATAFQKAFIALLKGEAQLMDLEHEMLHADGQYIWVQTQAEVAERDEHGRAVRVVGTTKDITTAKQAELALRTAKAEAENSSLAKADFLANLSHEIRTPINGVIGLTRMLEETHLPDGAASYVGMIKSCSTTLLALVNDVLDFSKIEAGQVEIQNSDLDLHALVQETADVFAARAQEKGVGFAARIASDVPRWVSGDQHRVRQILLNLLGNALKFTDAGQFAVTVTAQRDGVQDLLRFDVSDTGIGIPKAAQDSLFRRYVQVDPTHARQRQGTGLGLAICRELAVLMGGDIRLASTLGVGSTFTVEIPLLSASQAAQPTKVASKPVMGLSEAVVLLVDDNAINQLVAKSLLSKLGVGRVVIAENGEVALSLCEKERFDLVLMDCQMPVMDGWEATRQLRSKGFIIPIVALTASAVSDERDLCLSCGMNDFLPKPIVSSQLAAALQRWIVEFEPVDVGGVN